MRLDRFSPAGSVSGGDLGLRPGLAKRNLAGTTVSSWTNFKRTAESSFDPLTSIGWHSLFWAGDTSWTNPGDGNVVSSWKNSGSSAANVTAAGAARPTYRASTAQFNGKPTVEFNGSNTLASSIISTITPPYSVVVIAQYVSAGGARFMFDTGAHNASLFYTNAGTSFDIYNGAPANILPIDYDPHCWAVFWRSGVGASSVIQDGFTKLLGGADQGIVTGNQLRMSADAPGHFQFAFVGVFMGDLSADPSWPDLKTWITTQYGMTVA